MSDIGGMLHKVTGNGLGLGHLKAAAPVGETTAPTQETSTVPTSGDSDVVVDTVALSDDAQDFASGAPTTGPGKSHMSTAHRAMEALKGSEALAGLPFGKIVSTLARGGTIESLLPPPPPPTETEETSVVAPVEGTDPEAEESVPASSETPIPLALPEVPDLEIAPEDAAIVGLLEAIANPEEDETESDVTDLFETEDDADPELG